MKRFEDSLVWQKSRDLAVMVYRSLESCTALGLDLEYLNKDDFDRLTEHALEVSRFLGGFIKKF